VTRFWTKETWWEAGNHERGRQTAGRGQEEGKERAGRGRGEGGERAGEANKTMGEVLLKSNSGMKMGMIGLQLQFGLRVIVL